MVLGREQLRDWIGRRFPSSTRPQRDAADLLGVHEVYISQILSGIRTPGLDNAIKIEKLTGISVESWAQSQLSEAADIEPVAAGKRKVARR